MHYDIVAYRPTSLSLMDEKYTAFLPAVPLIRKNSLTCRTKTPHSDVSAFELLVWLALVTDRCADRRCPRVGLLSVSLSHCNCNAYLAWPAFFRPLASQQEYRCRLHYGDSMSSLEDATLDYRFETINNVLRRGFSRGEMEPRRRPIDNGPFFFHQFVHSDPSQV